MDLSENTPDGGFWQLWYTSGDLACDLEEMEGLPERVRNDLADMIRASESADPCAVVGLVRAAQVVVACPSSAVALLALVAALKRLEASE